MNREWSHFCNTNFKVLQFQHLYKQCPWYAQIWREVGIVIHLTVTVKLGPPSTVTAMSSKKKKKSKLGLWSHLYFSCPWLKGFKGRRRHFFWSLRWHLTDLGNRHGLKRSTQEGLWHEWLLKANKIVMHSVHLTSHSLTKDSFLLDFIFLLIVTITHRAEMDQIPDTMKTAGKKHTILKSLTSKSL